MIASEPLLTLDQAAARFPSHGKAGVVCRTTLSRWVNHGVEVAGGRRVKLESVRVGNRVYTSVAALERFAAAQERPDEAPAPVPTAGAKRARESQRQDRELEALGFGRRRKKVTA